MNCWKDQDTVAYGYDALGRRVMKESDPASGRENEAEYYLYNGLGLNVLAEYQVSLKQHGRSGVKGEIDQVKEYYYGNGFLLASQETEEPYKYRRGWNQQRDISFYHQDILRSIVMITGKNGQVEETYQYDVWGKAYDGEFEENVYGFTGQRYQPELGIYSFAYRDYDPRTMRWMTVDPVKDGLNWHQYCGSNPVNFIDLYGLLYTLTIYVDQPGKGGDKDQFEFDLVDRNGNVKDGLIDVGHTWVEVQNKETGEIVQGSFSYKDAEPGLFNDVAGEATKIEGQFSWDWDVKMEYSLTEEQYQAATNKITEDSAKDAELTYNTKEHNCTDWTKEVAEEAGQNVPDTGTWYYNADNPGQLGEELMEQGGVRNTENSSESGKSVTNTTSNSQ